MQRRSFLATAALALGGAAKTAEGAERAEPFPLRGGERILFLGDSITNAGMYVEYVDAYLRTRFPEKRFELLNLGLPSETVSGLSEPDHPYPRPNVHERLDRALARTRPDVVVACYGMNDGIYYPFAEERFERYRQGIRTLLEKCRAAGAKVTLMTPPPFDPFPVREHTLPASAPKFGWMTPYSGYDTVLERYSGWLLTQSGSGVRVVDLHTPISRFLADRRAEQPDFLLAGDGVHPNATGHALIAVTLLAAWNAPATADFVELDSRRHRLIHGAGHLEPAEDGGARVRWRTRLPMPYDPQWDPHFVKAARVTERLNRFRLRITELPEGRYALLAAVSPGSAERRTAEYSREELQAGVDLLKLADFPPNRRAAELLPLVQQRQRLLGPAWLTSVGHKRPGTPSGLPLDEAQRQAAVLDEQARRLAQPLEIELRTERLHV